MGASGTPLTTTQLDTVLASGFRYLGGLILLGAGLWDLIHGGNTTVDGGLIAGGASVLGVAYNHP
jgi:hypothetical protein